MLLYEICIPAVLGPITNGLPNSIIPKILEIPLSVLCLHPVAPFAISSLALPILVSPTPVTNVSSADDTLVTGVGDTSIGNARDEIANGATGCKHSTDNGISKILGIMEFGSPLVIGPRTAGIQISYNNTRGLTLNDGDGEDSNVIYLWDVSFFDFTMTTKVRRSRGAWR